MKNNKRDIIVLKKMIETCAELKAEIVFAKISQASDLAGIRPITKRGMIHATGDIFELSKKLTMQTRNKLSLSDDVMREFRNKVAHNYGKIEYIEAFMWIKHCTSKELDKELCDLIKDLSRDPQSKILHSLPQKPQSLTLDSTKEYMLP